MSDDEAHVAVGELGNDLQIAPVPPIIAIVGYGCAGIAAAWRLLAKGYEVRVYDALNRRGGRACTVTPFGEDIPIDLGCQWQHGPQWAQGIADHLPDGAGDAIVEHNLAARLQHHAQQIRHHYAHPRNVVYSAAENLNFPSPETIVGGIWNALETGDDDDVTADAVIAAWIAADGGGAATYDAAPRYLKEFGKAILGELEEGRATDTYSVVDLRLGEDRVADDAETAGFAEVEDGYNAMAHANNISQHGFGSLITAVAEVLEACYQDRLVVSLNNRVTNIRYDDTIPNGKVRVTADEAADFNAVIVTTSMGVLQHGGLAFVPALPDELMNAIGLLPMGHYKKIALRFTANIFAHTRSEADNAIQRPGVEYYNDGSIYLIANEARDTWRFLFNYRASHVVVAIVGGALALELDQLDNDAVRARMVEALIHVTGYDVRQHLAEGLNIATSRWSQEQDFRGAYSSINVGGNDPRSTLRHAFPQNKVCFAGEVLWNAEYGSAHAALLSGRFAAHQVIQAHPMPNEDL